MPSIEGILDRQLRKWEADKSVWAKTRTSPGEPVRRLQPIITVSRQRGTGGTVLAQKLAERFSYTLLDRDIIDRMCESAGYKRRILESLDEHSTSQLRTWVEAMLAGSYVDASDYVKGLFEIIYSISQLGGVVVVGRGANFIVGPERGFHIRVVGPRELRARHLMQTEKLGERDALREIEASDHSRADFIRKVYGRSIDDPLAYDLVINNVFVTMDVAASLVAAAAMEKFGRIRAGAVAGG